MTGRVSIPELREAALSSAEPLAEAPVVSSEELLALVEAVEAAAEVAGWRPFMPTFSEEATADWDRLDTALSRFDFGNENA